MSFLTSNNKALVLAMDHAQAMGAVPGLENPGAVIDAAVEAGVEAIMTTMGVIKRYKSQLIGRVPTIMRLDAGPSVYLDDWRAYSQVSLLHTVEDALFLGADAVVVNLFIGIPVELDTFRIVSQVAGECMRANLPVLVEAIPCLGPRIPDPDAAEFMAAASRLAFEHGADFVKTYYTGTPEGFRHVTDNCPVPVLIAGGPKMDTTEAALTVVSESIQAGSSGVVFGRNIWQSGNIPGMLAALQHIIHHNGTVSEAMVKLESA